MSTLNSDENIKLKDLLNEINSHVENEDEKTVSSDEESEEMTKDNEVVIEKQHETRSIESQDDDTNEDDQLNTTRNRELKSLLALSKEAKLDINISHKRKSFDIVKSKDPPPLIPLKPVGESDQSIKKMKTENVEKFPVTAESELESMVTDSNNTIEGTISDKVKKEEPKGKETNLVEERKNIKDIKVFKPNKDMFCWRCHREGVNVCCETCPRSYHQKCLKQTISDENNWPCPECVSILKAESTQTRSTAMKGMTLEHLCSLLKFAVKRMMECNGSEPFLHPVNDKDFPEYKKYIIQPMNLTLLEKNIKENLYGSTQAFEADAKWILHNSIIFNSYQSKLTTFAKSIIKICKQEMAEIENCPSCYLNANTKKSTWFVEVCPKPHILLWAKLKGFPYWPAKAMCTNSAGMVDVRFFGEHDRAWVPSRECFLYSRRDPNSNKQKRNDIIECMKEVEVYISNIKALYGEFNYAPFKLPYDPDQEVRQIRLFIPRYKPNMPPPKRKHKSPDAKSKTLTVKEEAEVEKENQDSHKDEFMEGYGTDDETSEKESVGSRKRRAKPVQESLNTTVDKEEEMDEDSEDSESEEEDEKIEPELDDDTQVSGSVDVDKVPRGSVRTRGGFKSSPGRLRIIPRRISEENISRSRVVAEDGASPAKLSRRNSDQSVKSDSSRLSTLSDKINRVDFSENVELTLGNNHITSSTSSETRKKPVQIDVENSELSISPQNKIKITDRLMKIFSSDEEVSKSPDAVEAKSQTDILLEKYKNLVKVKSGEFDIVEASTSFGSTSIPAKEACKSNDEGAKTEMDKEDATEAEVNGKMCDSASDQMATSSTDTAKDVVEKKMSGSKEKSEIVAKETPLDKRSSDINNSTLQLEPKEETNKDKEVDVPKEKDVELPKKESSITNSIKFKKSQAPTPPKVIEIKEKPAEESKEKKEERPIEIKKLDNSEVRTYLPKKLIATKNVDKIATNSKEVDSSGDDKLKNTDSEEKMKVGEPKIVGEIETKKEDTNCKATDSSENEIITEVIGEDAGQVLYQVDSNSSDAHETALDDIQLLEVNIRNIIHSSLNKTDRKKRKIEENDKDQKHVDRNEVSPETKKQKVGITERAVAKTPDFKIVPIQSILDKNIHQQPSNRSLIENNPILMKKLSQTKQPEPNRSLPPCVEIKSEPESTDEEMEESEYMEKKRKYMSALNISEKTEEVAPPKKNEIRTRSKTEEMGRGKNLDNLCKVIDEVATSFSAKHEAVKKAAERKTNSNVPQSNVQSEDERRKGSQENGEIFVKSFAKIQQQQSTRPSTSQQRVLKPKLFNNNNNNNANLAVKTQVVRREAAPAPKINPEHVTITPTTRITVSSNVVTTNSVSSTSVPPAASQTLSTHPLQPPGTSANKTIESLSSSGNVLILTQPGMILPTSQQLTYNAGSFVTFVPSQHNLTMVQSPQVINAVVAPTNPQNESGPEQRHPNAEVQGSQNYIPPYDADTVDKLTKKKQAPTSQAATSATNGVNQVPIAPNEVPSLIPINDNRAETSTVIGPSSEMRGDNVEDEFSLLNSMVPESVSKAISEVLCRPPPKLKRRPPGPLSQVFDTGNPSSAGPVSAKINSISHRLGDYFRGMLIELLEDLGKTNNPEATISSLRHEIETLQHKHATEMMDIRKNVCTILKDIQGSIAEERERIIDETRSACEVEALKRIEEAKSKQWCANCGKEAQFYCCWNTSYCDYPCQQKHWSKHMNKCSQHVGQPQPGQSPTVRPQSQITFRPATPTYARIVAKPAKVYLNRTTNSKTVPAFKSSQVPHLTLLETSNLEFLTNSAMGAKFIASNSLLTKVKNVNSTVTSPSSGSQLTTVSKLKMNSSISIVKPSPSTSNNISNLISDEEP